MAEIFDDPIAQRIVEIVLQVRPVMCPQSGERGARAFDDVRCVHVGVGQARLCVLEQYLKADVPVPVPVASGLVTQLLDRPQQLALHGPGLPAVGDKLLPNALCFFEILHPCLWRADPHWAAPRSGVGWGNV